MTYPVGRKREWVRAFELQKWRGVPHIHALVAGVSDRRWKYTQQFMWDKYGMIKILPYPGAASARYVAKYVVKEFGNIAFSSDLSATT